MHPEDESEKIRQADDDWDAQLGRREQPGDCGAPAIVARTISQGAYPTIAGRYYAILPQSILGPEVEGGPGTQTPSTKTLYALNLGTAIPPIATPIIATFISNRWVFRHDG